MTCPPNEASRAGRAVYLMARQMARDLAQVVPADREMPTWIKEHLGNLASIAVEHGARPAAAAPSSSALTYEEGAAAAEAIAEELAGRFARQTDVPGMEDLTVEALADAVTDLARLALSFAAVNRTAVFWPDGATPESDTDHTVMLGWVACSLAARYFPGLDVGLVAQYALVHDAPEVYAGDTPTLRIDDDGRAAKARREAAATARLERELGRQLPWLPALVRDYEAQHTPEARFVRGVDKILPKMVHVLDGCAGLIDHGMTAAKLEGVFTRQATDMASYVGEFTELMDLRAELVGRVIRLRRHLETGGTGA